VGSPGTREQALAAALRWAGEEAALAGRTALEVWGIARRAPSIELLVPQGLRRRDARFVLHRSSTFDVDQRVVRRGLVVTTPERTIVDLVGVMSGEELEAAAEALARARLLRWDRLAGLAADVGGHGKSGSAALRSLVESRDPALAPTNLELERRTWTLLRTSGLPLPLRNHRVTLPGGAFELDFAWEQQKVALETDGFAHHSDRVAFRHDRRRWAAIVAGGWRVLVATWDDVNHRVHSQRLIDQIAATLELAV